jgi:hypothetical protein
MRFASPPPWPPPPLAGFAIRPQAAAALLSEAATFDPGPGRWGTAAADVMDPVNFAEQLDAADWLDFFEHGAAEEMAAFKQAWHQVIDALGTDPRDLPFDHPLHRLPEWALDLWVISWMAGVRFGSAAEHLRLAATTPRMLCRTCDGQGETWGDHWFRDEAKPRATCPECGRAGSVVTPPARPTFSDQEAL